jgi:hypothetical protein
VSDPAARSPLTVVAVMDDLMLLSRIDAAAAAAGATLRRVDAPADVGEADLVLVDWSARTDAWAPALAEWRAAHPDARIVLFGRHTDLESHAAAKAAGLGPMWARSKLVADLARLLEPTVAF